MYKMFLCKNWSESCKPDRDSSQARKFEGVVSKSGTSERLETRSISSTSLQLMVVGMQKVDTCPQTRTIRVPKCKARKQVELIVKVIF